MALTVKQIQAAKNKRIHIMNEKQLRHGQAIALQWLAFTLQQLKSEISTGGETTKKLLGNVASDTKDSDLSNIAIGADYVIKFILPLTIELALKALLLKERKPLIKTHNLFKLYENLSPELRTKLNEQFRISLELGGVKTTKSLPDLLKKHKNDFIEWRYLDDPSTLQNSDNEIQYAICALLDVYNTR